MTRKLMLIGAVVLALGALSAGIAIAAGGSDDEQVTGVSAEQAGSAAVKAVGGGTVLEVERQDGDGPGVFEVEVRRADGSQVEVHLDDRFQPVGTAADDDSGSDADDEGDEGVDD